MMIIWRKNFELNILTYFIMRKITYFNVGASQFTTKLHKKNI